MNRITNQQVADLQVSPAECLDWIRQSFCCKYDAQLPTKISIHPQGSDFFNTMPCLLPQSFDRFGVKVVSRIAGQHPALHSELLLYRASDGQLLSFMEADWITQMRTGAVAALAILTFERKDAETYAFVGLGSTAEATMKCLLAGLPEGKRIVVKLLRYKDQAERFAAAFECPQAEFRIVDTHEELVSDSDVIVSAVTEMPELFCADDSLYKEGVTVVPIHTRGFQNCDLFFDHVFADDRGHVCGFRYFDRFRQFNEFSEVLLGKVPARTSDSERILVYNIGLGLHDVFFANKLYERFTR